LADWQNTPFTVPLLLIGLLCCWVAYVGWRRRTVPGATPFAVLTYALAAWTLVNLVEKSLVNHELRRAVSAFVYVFIVTVPGAWFVFAARFSRQDRWLTRRRVGLLFVEPILVLGLVFTDSWHGLFRTATEMRTDGPYAIMVITQGPFFFVNAAYTYLLFAAGAVLLVTGVVHRPDWTYARLAVLLGAMLVPVLGNVAYVFHLQPERWTDLTPVYFAVPGLAAAWLLFHVRVFDVLPIARDFVLDCLGDAVFVLDNRCRILDANPVARSLLPAAPPVRMQPLADVLPELSRCLPGQLGARASTTEIQLRSAGAERFWDVHVLPMVDQGVTIGVLVRLTEVTERKRAEVERRAFEERLRQAQKLESLGVLAGGIAHDFNNLLTVILGNVELARKEFGGSPGVAPLLQAIVQAAEWGATLTKQILIYAGKGRSVVQPILLSPLIEGIAGLLRSATSKQAVLELDLAPDLPPVLGDPTQLRQLVLNLVTNASEALGHQPGSVCVRTRVAEITAGDLAAATFSGGLVPGVHLWLEVSDTGAGMDSETRARIFEPFFTTKFIGRGLGLAVVLGIVRGYGGAIFVHSERGAGTVFRVVLPRAPRPEPPTTPPPSPMTGEVQPG
jgi:signal transduction histidine kinase